jgi:hypothetical protein
MRIEEIVLTRKTLYLISILQKKCWQSSAEAFLAAWVITVVKSLLELPSETAIRGFKPRQQLR